jgi:hypothetical protein
MVREYFRVDATQAPCCQIEQRKIAKTARRRLINRAKQCDHLFPGERARQPLKSIGPWRVNVQVQWSGQIALGMLVPQKSPQRRNDVLEAETVIRPRCLAQKCADLFQVQSPNYRGTFVQFEDVKEKSNPAHMPYDRHVGQAAHLSQVCFKELKLLLRR